MSHIESNVVNAMRLDASAEIGLGAVIARDSRFLHERASPPAAAGTVSERSAARASRWQSRAGLDEAAFDRRLARVGLDTALLRRMLEATHASLPPADDDEPGWLSVIGAIDSGACADRPLPEFFWSAPDGSKTSAPPFSGFVNPFVQVAKARLEDEIRRMGAAEGEAVWTPGVEIAFLASLTNHLFDTALPTLTLELNVARVRGELRGATPEERFTYFSAQYLTPERVLDLLREYPVLARLLAVSVEQWVESTVEFVSRFRTDRSLIGQALFDGAEIGALTVVQLNLSDRHRGGRSVIIAGDAAGRRFVYKPVCLAVDAGAHEFVRTVNALGLRHEQRTIRVLDRGTHGWMEFVEARGCGAPDELRRFYWRQGSWMALLHVLRGADFHRDNLIAAGEHPVVIDFEGLFQHSPQLDSADDESGASEARLVMRRSVLRQGLLPFVVRMSAGERGLDGSGLSSGTGHGVPGGVLSLSNAGTDEMRIQRDESTVDAALNRPTLSGRSVDLLDYLPDIVTGFTETYQTLAAHADTLRPLLRDFASRPVRQIMRDTRLYALLQRAGKHPDELRDGLARSELLDRLWAQSASDPRYERLVTAEVDDMLQGDIPVFTTLPGETDLWDSRGGRIADFFARSSLADAEDALASMGPADLERQLLLIRLTISEGESRLAEPKVVRPTADLASDAHARPAELTASAEIVGELLKRRMILTKGGEVTWVTMDPFVEDLRGGARFRDVALVGSDLYLGVPGITLFLAHLARQTRRADFAELARAGLATVRRSLGEARNAPATPIGAFVGTGGHIYALLHLARLWSEPALIDEALQLLPRLERALPGDVEYDIIGGAAGCAVILGQLHAASGEAAALRLAQLCGDHLIRHARADRAGMYGWVGTAFDRPAPGLSHGSAGIAWALLDLAQRTGSEEYREVALRAIDAERTLLLSPDGEPFAAHVSWCHGWPSVAMARALSAPHFLDGRVQDELARGARDILGVGPMADACLCHGTLGNAEILATSGRVAGRPEWSEASLGMAHDVAREVRRLEHALYLPLHGRFAGLMCGLAGIGMGLLRFADPDSVPSVLALSPAPAAGYMDVTASV